MAPLPSKILFSILTLPAGSMDPRAQLLVSRGKACPIFELYSRERFLKNEFPRCAIFCDLHSLRNLKHKAMTSPSISLFLNKKADDLYDEWSEDNLFFSMAYIFVEGL